MPFHVARRWRSLPDGIIFQNLFHLFPPALPLSGRSDLLAVIHIRISGISGRLGSRSTPGIAGIEVAIGGTGISLGLGLEG